VLTAQVEKDRPPEGLARGRYEAPPWAIAALGAAVGIGALAFVVVRLVRRARAPKGDFAPSSRRPPGTGHR
jgi:hypothetical protein